MRESALNKPLGQPSPAIRREGYLIAVLLVLAAAFMVAIYTRSFLPDLPPDLLTELALMELSPYFIGYLLELKLIPVVLLFLLFMVPYFRAAIQDPNLPGASRRILLGLIAVQSISYSYGIWFSRTAHEPFFGELLVVIVGGLLGGWKTGLVLGLLSMVYKGGYELLFLSPFLEEINHIGLYNMVYHSDWMWIVAFHFINSNASMGLWMGLVAGLTADLLGEYRYTIPAALGLGLGIELLVGVLSYVGGMPPGLPLTPPSMLVTGLAMTSIVLLIRSVQAEAQRRKVEAAELALAQAELRALRAQINPHFLFNALNTIRYAIRTDPEAARRLLLDLSEVFQRALQAGEFVPLSDELSYVQAYLSLEKARLGERLNVVCCGQPLDGDFSILSNDPLMENPVPTLTIQPLVENAVIHGISKKPEGGTVDIDFQQVDDELHIEVKDDGMGIDQERIHQLLESTAVPSTSLGLRNIDGRLRALFGDEYRLKIEPQPAGGTCVQMRLPLKTT